MFSGLLPNSKDYFHHPYLRLFHLSQLSAFPHLNKNFTEHILCKIIVNVHKLLCISRPNEVYILSGVCSESATSTENHRSFFGFSACGDGGPFNLNLAEASCP